MKLLIITQKVNKDDADLGFFHDWIREFAQRVEKLTVICLEEGKYDLPANTKIISLGKEKRGGRFLYTWNFYKNIIKLRREYDVVFVHMNPEYIVLGGILWRLLRKKVALWYVHRSVDFNLRIAEKLCNQIFTSAPESFGIKSKKVYFMGHGINTREFFCEPFSYKQKEIEILSMGRVTPIKHGEKLIECVKILRDIYNTHCHVSFVGPIKGKKDMRYKKSLDALVASYHLDESVTFVGGIVPALRNKYYCKSYITVNLAPTGGLDKVVIESMAAGRVVFTSNEAFIPYFGPYAEKLVVKEGDPATLAKRIVEIQDVAVYNEIAEYLTVTAQNKFDVAVLVTTIIRYLEEKK